MSELQHIMTIDERRDFVQKAAKSSLRKREFTSKFFLGMMATALVIAFIPLFSILQSVISKGAHYLTWGYLSKPQQTPFAFDLANIGGFSNAITGTILVDGLAVLIAVPIAVLLAVSLYESDGRVMHFLRVTTEVMIGLPSILLGIFIFTFVVTPMGYRMTALAGSLALAILMVPLIAIASEAALRDVPDTLKEAALALGARKSRVMLRVILPYAAPRMVTAVMLSTSRAVGETAPVLFVIGASSLTSWNPMSPVTTLPTMMFTYLQGSNPYIIKSLWGMALILMIIVFFFNLLARLVVARSSKRGL